MSKDVIEQACEWIEDVEMNGFADESGDVVMQLIMLLVSALRAARKDSERLDWVLNGGPIEVSIDCGKGLAVVETRADIDAETNGKEMG